MKLGSLEDDGTNLGNTEEEALVGFGKLARLTSVDSNLSDRFSLPKYGDPKYRGYSLR